MAEKTKVYFADFRAPGWRENLPQKLARLMMTAGFGDIDMERIDTYMDEFEENGTDHVCVDLDE